MREIKFRYTWRNNRKKIRQEARTLDYIQSYGVPIGYKFDPIARDQ